MGRPPPPDPLGSPPAPPQPPSPPKPPKGSSRFPSDHPAPIRRLLALWPILTALAAGAAATWGWLETSLQRRIETAVRAHDDGGHDAKPHPSLEERILALEGYRDVHEVDQEKLRMRVERDGESLKEVYWWLVGDKGADMERNPRHRAEAAREARERFLRYVRDGETYEEAYRHALPSSFPQ